MALDEEFKSKVRRYADGAPWRFRGRALYQMHLVKADIARRYIPAELKLVEAFGYTLGGFYLAHYDDSPAGEFDELVVISGTVWNPPTSCAWAAQVLVNSTEACAHGRREVGLPSRLATFHYQTVQEPRPTRLRLPLLNSSSNKQRELHSIHISRSDAPFALFMSLPTSLLQGTGAKGPSVRFSLPSFSGKTDYQPNLLKYSCDLICRVAMAKPGQISLSNIGDDGIASILMSKPVFAMSFQDMTMTVRAPSILEHKKR